MSVVLWISFQRHGSLYWYFLVAAAFKVNNGILAFN